MIATRSRVPERTVRLLLVALVLPLLTPPPSASAQEAAAPSPSPSPEARAPRFSGLLFGDYYAVARSHRDALPGRNGFWIRRVYLAYDQPLSGAFSMRLRLETNSRGDFETTGNMTVYMKDAWLRFTRGAHALTFGLSATPVIEFIDQLQGYRPLEKSPLDLYKWDASRDTGLVAQGKLGTAKRTQYTFGLGNGSGNGSETDENKTFRGQLVHRLANGLVLEAYGDWQDRPDGRSWSTLEATLACQRPSWRASLEYGRQQRRRAGSNGSDLALDFVSAFGSARVRPNLSLVARADRVFDPVPGSDSFDYFPFAEKARFVVGYAGVDLLLAKNVHLLPNVELARYDRAADGTRPEGDVMPRLTVSFTW